MKRKKFVKGSVVLGLICAGILVAITLFGQQSVSAQPEVGSTAGPALVGQQWSSEQKEVWNTVEKIWGLYAKEDLEGAMTYVHPSFRGWISQDQLPRTKAGESKWAGYFLSIQKTLVTELKPVAIDIHDDFSFVHYFYTLALKDNEGKHKIEQGRWTDTYKKEGEKWLIICDHGGMTSEK